MKCANCNHKTSTQKIAEYHYSECGLKNIYLNNLDAYICPNCEEEEILIPNLEELHSLIARDVAQQSERLKPEEIRFLRVHLGLSGSDFAHALSLEPETVSRWETGKTEMKLTNERFLRILILSNAGPFRDYSNLQTFGTSSKKTRSKLQFNIHGDHWRAEAA